MTSVHPPHLPPLPAHARAGHVTVNKDIPTIRLKQVSTVLQNPDMETELESILTVGKSKRSIWIDTWTKVHVLNQTEQANNNNKKKNAEASFKGKILAIAEEENLNNLWSLKTR